MNQGNLGGCGVLITRAQHQAHELKSAIEAADGDTFLFPAIDIVGRDIDEIGRELADLPEPDVVCLAMSDDKIQNWPSVSGTKINPIRTIEVAGLLVGMVLMLTVSPAATVTDDVSVILKLVSERVLSRAVPLPFKNI